MAGERRDFNFFTIYGVNGSLCSLIVSCRLLFIAELKISSDFFCVWENFDKFMKNLKA